MIDDQLDINKLFEDMLEEEVVVKKQSQLQLKEQKRLEVLHSFNKNNIDNVFDTILNHKDNPFYVGAKFGKREIIDSVPVSKKNRLWLKCLCECGKELLTRPDLLISLKAGSCKDCAKIQYTKRINEICKNKEACIGQVFGRRTVIEVIGRINNKNEFMVICKCECGHIGPVRYALLKRGKRHACAKCTKPGPIKKNKKE